MGNIHIFHAFQCGYCRILLEMLPYACAVLFAEAGGPIHGRPLLPGLEVRTVRKLHPIILAALVVAIAATLGSVAHAAPDVSLGPLHLSGGVLAIVCNSPQLPALSVEYDGIQLLLGIGRAIRAFPAARHFGRLSCSPGPACPGPGRTGSLIMSGRTPPMRTPATALPWAAPTTSASLA